jgi:hypothetical protein
MLKKVKIFLIVKKIFYIKVRSVRGSVTFVQGGVDLHPLFTYVLHKFDDPLSKPQPNYAYNNLDFTLLGPTFW